MNVVNVLREKGKTVFDSLSKYLTRIGQWSKLPWLRWLYAAVMVVALTLLCRSVILNWETLSSYNWKWNWQALIPALSCYCMSLLWAIYGWRDIMYSLGVNIPFRKHWKVYTFTNLARRLPTAIWYASGRLLMYEQLKVAKRITSVALIIEVVVTAYAGAISGAILTSISGQSIGWAETKWIYMVLLVGIIFVVRPQWALKIFNALQRHLNQSLFDITLNWRDMMRWTGIYTLNWLSGGFMLYWMIRILYPVPFQAALGIISMWIVSGVVATIFTTILPFSFGPRELVLTLLLSSLIPPPVAATISVLSRVWLGINQLIWFGISWLL